MMWILLSFLALFFFLARWIVILESRELQEAPTTRQ